MIVIDNDIGGDDHNNGNDDDGDYGDDDNDCVSCSHLLKRLLSHNACVGTGQRVVGVFQD